MSKRVLRSLSLVGFGVFAIGCGTTSEGASTTVQTTTVPTTPDTTAASTTTVPPTTTTTSTSVASTTVAPTTVAITTVPTTQANADEAEIRATLDAFYKETDGCYAAPDACDMDAVLARYTLPNTTIAEWRRGEMRFLLKRGWVVEDIDAIKREVKEVKLFDTPGRAYTLVCERDDAISVSYRDGTRTVESDGRTDYRREYYWEKLDGKWIIIESIMTYTQDTVGEIQCEPNDS